MGVIRFTTGVAVAAFACAALWRVCRGRWKVFAGAVTIGAAGNSFLLAEGQQIDGWGIVAVAVWGFLVALLLAALLVVPALALWPSDQGGGAVRASAALALCLAWAVTIHVLFVVRPAWERWSVCLPPAVERAWDGERSCEVGPL